MQLSITSFTFLSRWGHIWLQKTKITTRAGVPPGWVHHRPDKWRQTAIHIHTYITNDPENSERTHADTEVKQQCFPLWNRALQHCTFVLICVPVLYLFILFVHVIVMQMRQLSFRVSWAQLFMSTCLPPTHSQTHNHKHFLELNYISASPCNFSYFVDSEY